MKNNSFISDPSPLQISFYLYKPMVCSKSCIFHVIFPHFGFFHSKKPSQPYEQAARVDEL